MCIVYICKAVYTYFRAHKLRRHLMTRKRSTKRPVSEVTYEQQLQCEDDYDNLIANLTHCPSDSLSMTLDNAHDNVADAADLLKLATQQLMADASSNRLIWNRTMGPEVAQTRAHEEASLKSVGRGEHVAACANCLKLPSTCVANTLFWPEKNDLQMATYIPEGSNAGKGDGVCLLCLRFLVQRLYYANVQMGVSLHKDALITEHRNIVGIPGEYAAEDCLHPLSVHCGTLGPIVKLQKGQYALEITETEHGIIYRVIQLHRRVDAGLPDF